MGIYKGIVGVVLILLLCSTLYSNENSKERTSIDSFCIEPYISSSTEIRTIHCFNLEFSDDRFYIKGYLEPREDWNEDSVVSFQFRVDTELIRRMVEPKPEGFPSEALEADIKDSFLATNEWDSVKKDWKYKTTLDSFTLNDNREGTRKYEIKLSSNETFYNNLIEGGTKKFLYFEICFLTKDYDRKGHKLEMEGKKEIYLLITPTYFAVGEEYSQPESLYFAMHFEGKEIEDYYPQDAIIKKGSIKYYLGEWIHVDGRIVGNTIKEENTQYHILRKNYEMLFLIHLTLKDPPGILERTAHISTFLGLISGLIIGILSLLGVQSLLEKRRERRKQI